MDRLGALDLGAHFFFQTLRRPWLDPVMLGITHVGDREVVIGVAVMATLVFFVLKHPWTAIGLILATCLGFGISESVKKLVNRPRPPDVNNPAAPAPLSPSFPSGHALGSAAVYGCIGLAIAHQLRTRRARRLVIALGFFLPFLIGVSRLYLGVHFVFDVVGGWTAGAACALLGHWVARSFAPPTPDATSSLAHWGSIQ